MAVAGAALYLILISGKAPDDKGASSGAGTSAAEIGTLTKNTDGSSNTLWSTINLSRCELSAGAVPVLKRSGKGVAADPYVVETLGRPDGCPRITFSVIDAVATYSAEKPQEVKIEYEPLKSSTTTTVKK